MNDLMTTGGDLIAAAVQIQDVYTSQIRQFAKWARSTGNGLDELGIRAYFEELNRSGLAASTICVRRAAVKRRIRQLFHDAPIEERMKIDRALSDLDHDGSTKAPKIADRSVGADKVISPAEYREMILRARSDRQRAFLRFLWTTGCRVAELAGIELDRCEQIDGAVKIRLLGKGSKERFVRIPVDLFAFVRSTFGGSRYLFETASGRAYDRTYISEQIRRVGKLIGRNISAHTFRHSFASRTYQRLPGKLDALSRYLGHSTTSITLSMYCHSQLSNEELFAEAV